MKTHGNVAQVRAGKYRGFTLIELVIAVVIVGILAAVAFPMYKDQLKAGRRAAAQSLILDIANREQQYLLDAREYAIGTSALTTLTVTVPTDVSKYYTITIGPTTATIPPSFTITAAPIGDQVGDQVGTMSLSNNGTKTYTGTRAW